MNGRHLTSVLLTYQHPSFFKKKENLKLELLRIITGLIWLLAQRTSTLKSPLGKVTSIEQINNVKINTPIELWSLLYHVIFEKDWWSDFAPWSVCT